LYLPAGPWPTLATMDPVEEEIRVALRSSGGRQERAERIAEAIKGAGGYRWVGLYEVGEREIAVLAWSGPHAPEHPRFPVTDGLCGAAVAQRSAVVVGDVSADPRYLPTLGTTRSEIVVPVFGGDRDRVSGLIDVESEHRDAFTGADRGLLERCALLIAPLWA
jgi:putative methionine-R-sulfoxide reductase with GAF domain